MCTVIRSWIVCVGVACTGVALAGPKLDVRAKAQAAMELVNNGNPDQALVIIEEGLTIAPKDLPLLGLKGQALLALRDYPGALAAYEAYLKAGVTGANQRKAQDIVKTLGPVRTTFLDITLANGPAAIYLDSKAQGLFCTAAPACNKPMLPGAYRVIAERSGFDVWTGRVSVAAKTTTKLAVTLVEKPSLLTVRVVPAGARITIDGTAYDAPTRGAAITAAVLWLTGAPESRVMATPRVGPVAGLDLAVRF